jgi:hypothetical protein
MFDFKRKVLKPLIVATTAKIDNARETQNTTARIENLLSVKEHTDKAFSKIETPRSPRLLPGSSSRP